MKIDLNAVDLTQFMVHQHILGGQVVHLVQPQNIGINWTQETKIFRSSVWDNDGNLVSAGFPKFTNWGEKPEVFPLPKSLKGATIMEKIDGSLLVVSVWNGNLILRTRGTVDAYQLNNGHELEAFKEYADKLLSDWSEKYGETWPTSLLFEWVSPNQKIILNYGDEPQFYLVGAVEHLEYDIWPQGALDILAEMNGLLRPPHYTFNDVADLLANVEAWKGKEGVCVYSWNERSGDSIHKVKSADYLIRHRFKSEATLENTLNLFFSFGCPSYSDFESQLIQKFDYECFEMVHGYMSQVCDASKNVSRIIDGIKTFVEPLKSLLRKDAAKSILASYGSTGRSNMAFTLLDSKPLTTDQQKKLYWQCLKG
jgi:hypothetical protein